MNPEDCRKLAKWFRYQAARLEDLECYFHCEPIKRYEAGVSKWYCPKCEKYQK